VAGLTGVKSPGAALGQVLIIDIENQSPEHHMNDRKAIHG
jgi:hypothetical protein